jgi:hypothetical protein
MTKPGGRASGRNVYGFSPESVRQCVLLFGLVGGGCLVTGLIDTGSAVVRPAREAAVTDAGPAPDRPAPGHPAVSPAQLPSARPGSGSNGAGPDRDVQNRAAPVPRAGSRINTAPVRVTIAGRGGPIPVVPVGVVDNGRLEVPDDPHHVGWWAGGAAPGDPAGSVVLAGHLDSADQGLGVFATLLTVRTGQSVVVRDATGQQHRYQVTTRRSYPRDQLPTWVFQRGGPPRLMLLTCGGRYDTSRHHYTRTVVVLARPIG